MHEVSAIVDKNNMKWSNLKANKCPQCNRDLFGEEVVGGVFHCTCGFKITEKRMKEIVSSQVVKDIDYHYRPDDEVPEKEL